MLYLDDFAFDRGWELSSGLNGAVSLRGDRLVIAVRGPSATLFTLGPVPESGDFALEVTAHSELCGGGDEFGLLVRARSIDTHYRFTLTCEGEVRASRFVDGREAALAPMTEAEAATAGAPAVNRLGLLARGEQLVFSVNGIPALEVRDSQLASGRAGLIVRARRSAQTTVSFDDFNMWALGDD